MNEKTKISECPHCKDFFGPQLDSIDEKVTGIKFFVVCTDCGMQGPKLLDRQSAIEAWNIIYEAMVAFEDSVKELK